MWESHRRNRSCLPEIATAPSGPRNDKSGGIAPLNLCRDHCHPAWRSLSAATGPVGTGSILTIVCAYRQHCAGRGMPLPYNGVCGRRWCPEICSCQWRSLTAATDAIGLYVLSAAGTDCKCLPEIATGAKRPRNDNLGGIYHFNDSLYGRQVRRRARHASPLLFHTYRSSGQMSFSAEKTGRFSGKKFQKALAFRVFQCYNKDNL